MGVTIASIIMLVLAIPSGIWPYSYYQLLRWVVCGTCVYRAFLSYEHKQNAWMWILGVIGLTFNPLIPMRLDKESWAVIDLVAAVVLGLSLIPLRGKKEVR